MIRLLGITNFLGASPVTKAELTRRSGMQFEEATLNDLLLPAQSSNDHNASYDIDLDKIVLESFLRHWKRQTPTSENQSLRLIRKAGKLIDSYLQVVAKDAYIPVQKVLSLAEALPRTARPEHDDLFKAINICRKPVMERHREYCN
ncbi:Hypothetical predicted protein [Olea europaea subsp. europaea]|uniref:NPH3 domain-containing protein n=1 Tax=Olea europaea subsp. europaea TaxID=158383 RepID=A0A8S0TEL7_OLEEU|nr:Hypothetical predicted protein [Olea europaea subsp. europaea]